MALHRLVLVLLTLRICLRCPSPHLPNLGNQAGPRLDLQGVMSVIVLASYFLALDTFYSTRIDRDRLLAEPSDVGADERKASKVVSVALREGSETRGLPL